MKFKRSKSDTHKTHTRMHPAWRFFYLNRAHSSTYDVFVFMVKLWIYATAVSFFVTTIFEYAAPGGLYKDGLDFGTYMFLGATVFFIALGVGLPYVAVNANLFVRIRDSAERIEDAKQKLEQTVEQRARFVAYVSHELRNPLNGMIGILNTMDQSKLDTKTCDNLSILSKHSEDLLYIVNDILELSKVDSGKLELKSQSVKLVDLVKEQVNFWEAKAHTKNLPIKLKIADEIPKWVVVDPYRVRQILNNLMSNAIKHTEIGYVQVSVSVDKLGNNIEISVCDTGVGVPAALHEAIFDQYVQLPDVQNMPAKIGTGLGLPIARQLARMMGGDVILKSSSKAGTNFIMSFGLIEGQEAMVDVERREAVLETFTGMRALVVDDVSSNGFVAMAFLKKLGIEGEFLNTGRKAITRLQEAQFDIILLDEQLGKMRARDIYEETKSFQSDAKYIAYTGDGQQITEDRLKAIGFDGFLLKPVKFETIRDELVRVFAD